ncbi:MAG: hypothetical protein OJF55_001949 [Rhodanobacteraceae bacterium]|nr:MAG: hypothetical protein OJF55_001949 [Rhodanobacteraceae bacterium]
MDGSLTIRDARKSVPELQKPNHDVVVPGPRAARNPEPVSMQGDRFRVPPPMQPAAAPE